MTRVDRIKGVDPNHTLGVHDLSHGKVRITVHNDVNTPEKILVHWETMVLDREETVKLIKKLSDIIKFDPINE